MGKLDAAVVSMEAVAQNRAFKGYVRLATEVIQADGVGDFPVVDMQALSA